MNKSNFFKVIGGGVLVLAIIGAYLYPKQIKPTVGAVSPVGNTNASRRIATIVMVPLTSAATTTAILNGDSQDRAVTDEFAYCTGVGTSNAWSAAGSGGALTALLLQMSTSTASGNAGSNTNFTANLTVATATPFVYVSSTTVPAPNDVGRYWPSNTYLNITFNATNTANCTVGVSYLSL